MVVNLNFAGEKQTHGGSNAEVVTDSDSDIGISSGMKTDDFANDALKLRRTRARGPVSIYHTDKPAPLNCRHRRFSLERQRSGQMMTIKSRSGMCLHESECTQATVASQIRELSVSLGFRLSFEPESEPWVHNQGRNKISLKRRRCDAVCDAVKTMVQGMESQG